MASQALRSPTLESVTVGVPARARRLGALAWRALLALRRGFVVVYEVLIEMQELRMRGRSPRHWHF